MIVWRLMRRHRRCCIETDKNKGAIQAPGQKKIPALRDREIGCSLTGLLNALSLTGLGNFWPALRGWWSFVTNLTGLVQKMFYVVEAL